MADFTSAEMLVFRREYVGDYANIATGELLSYYNVAWQKNWMSDAVINSIKARVERDYSAELASVLANYATADAAAQVLDVTMRLVRCEIRERQMTDSGFLKAVGESGLDVNLLFRAYTNQITSDRHFLRGRAGAPYSSVQLERG